MPRVRRVPGLLALLAVAVVCFPPTACAVRSDEFLCEDAVAKVQGCCTPAASLQCKYVDEYCTPPTYPSLNEEQSRCIISASCSDLRAGACIEGGACW